MIKRSLIYVAGLLLAYFAVVFASTQIYVGNYNLFQYAIDDRVIPYWHGYTLTRFREVEKYKELDILFLGSSHAYQSFDPAVFSRLGITTFNIGSGSQTPGITYYMLEHYYDQLNPKLVVLELYPSMLELEGLEGLYELLPNRELATDIFKITASVGHPHGYNALAARMLRSLTHPIDDAVQQPTPNQEYREGGYIFSKIVNAGVKFNDPHPVKINETQIDFIHKLIEFVQSKNGDIVLATAPLPKELVQAFANFDEITALYSSIADEHGIRYVDFNQSLKLDTKDNFRDYHHLNANGAKIFSYTVVDSLLSMLNTGALSLLSVEPVHASDIVCGRAIAELSQGQYEKAMIDFDEALRLNPKSVKALFNRGVAFLGASQFESAIRDFDSAITLQPDDPRIYYNRGIARTSLGQHTDAIADLSLFIEAFPEAAEAHYNLARIYEAMERTTDAIKSYENFIKYASDQLADFVQPTLQHIAELRQRQ